MDNDAVLFEQRGPIGILTLNRPDNRNSMTAELLAAFSSSLGRALASADMRALVITGRGNCFCAGADFRAQVQADDAATVRLPHERSFAMYEPFLGVLDCEVPVIGALSGHAVGGGFGLALLCDIRIASRQAKYGANFARLGLHPGMAITHTLPRLIGPERAARMLYTGELVRGEEVVALGLASEALDAEAVLPRALEIATSIAKNAPIAVRMTRETLHAGARVEIRAAARREAFAQAASLETADAREGMQALLDKRDPLFSGR